MFGIVFFNNIVPPENKPKSSPWHDHIGIVLAEGYYTVKAMLNLSKDYGVDLPICSAVYNILYTSADAKTVLDELFTRSLKNEF